MKNLNHVLVLLFIFLFFSCSKEESSSFIESQNKITKEDILKICYSDDFATTSEVNGIEFEELLTEFLTPKELEKILIDFVTRNESKGSIKSETLKQFFSDYQDKFQMSFLEDSSEEQKNEFIISFKRNVLKVSPSLNKSICDFEDLECTDMEDGSCMLQENFVFYTQRKPCSRTIQATDCARQGEDEDHDDCDYSYHWSISQGIFNNNTPNAYIWNWYCNNSAYRAWMPSGISGYKIQVGSDYYASTFLGNRHDLGVWLFYFGDCKQDQWINDTRFEVLFRANTPKN